MIIYTENLAMLYIMRIVTYSISITERQQHARITRRKIGNCDNEGVSLGVTAVELCVHVSVSLSHSAVCL